MSVPTPIGTTSIGIDMASMSWIPVANAHHYEVRFRDVGGTWQIFTTTSTSMTKYGLSASTDYEWEVRSACSSDDSSVSAWSSTQTFTTDAPCTAPINNTTTSVGIF